MVSKKYDFHLSKTLKTVRLNKSLAYQEIMSEFYSFRNPEIQAKRESNNKWRANDEKLYSTLLNVLRSEKLDEILTHDEEKISKTRIRNMERQTKIKQFLEKICSQQDKLKLLELNWLLQISKKNVDHEYLWWAYLLFEFFEKFKDFNEKHIEYKTIKSNTDFSNQHQIENLNHAKADLMRSWSELKKVLINYRKKLSAFLNIDNNNLTKQQDFDWKVEQSILIQISEIFEEFLRVDWIDESNSLTWILGEVGFEQAINEISTPNFYIFPFDSETKIYLDSKKWIDFIIYYNWIFFPIDIKAQTRPPEDCEYIENNIWFRIKKKDDAKYTLQILEKKLTGKINSFWSKILGKKIWLDVLEIYLNTEHLWIHKTQDDYHEKLKKYIIQILEQNKRKVGLSEK